MFIFKKKKKCCVGKIIAIIGAVVAACAAVAGILLFIKVKKDKDAEIDEHINNEIDAEIEKVMAEIESKTVVEE